MLCLNLCTNPPNTHCISPMLISILFNHISQNPCYSKVFVNLFPIFLPPFLCCPDIFTIVFFRVQLIFVSSSKCVRMKQYFSVISLPISKSPKNLPTTLTDIVSTLRSDLKWSLCIRIKQRKIKTL